MVHVSDELGKLPRVATFTLALDSLYASYFKSCQRLEDSDIATHIWVLRSEIRVFWEQRVPFRRRGFW